MTLERLLIVSAAIFCIGLFGALTRRNLVTVLMCLELMFNAVNIALVAFSRYVTPAPLAALPRTASESVVQAVLTGQVFAIFIVTVAAAEVALGLGIVIALYRSRETVDASQANLMKR
ncbi:MAG: NADH-quinone oxidoreductase subunit NuoK [Chloroflexota bacterium]|nr:NADH-quinone oxidoreductase subunit NuoK [Chloroflexota bacterium]